MTLRLPLANNRLATFVSIYATTIDSSDDVKDRFHDTLYITLCVIYTATVKHEFSDKEEGVVIRNGWTLEDG